MGSLDPATLEAIKGLSRRVDALEHQILGNGRPGLVERVASIERGMGTQTWLLRTLIGVTVSTLIAVLIKGAAPNAKTVQHGLPERGGVVKIETP